MAFSDFKRISEVQEKFRIKYTANDFFEVEEAALRRNFWKNSSLPWKTSTFSRLRPHAVKPLSFLF